MPNDTEKLKNRLKRLGKVRRKFSDALTVPLQEALKLKSPIEVATRCYQLPVELMTAGFQVTGSLKADGLSLVVMHRIDRDCELMVEVKSASVLKTLLQIVDSMNRQLDQLEAETALALQTSGLEAVA